MQEFQYEVFDRQGRRQQGRAEAESAAELVRRLAGDGQTVVQLRPRAVGKTLRRRLGGQERLVALLELATLLESGVPLGDAILAQQRGSRHPQLAAAFAVMGKALAQGQSFPAALKDSGLSLPDYVHQLAEAGELTGHLAQALRQAVEQMECDQRMTAEFRSALTYPVVLVTAGAAAVLFVFAFVVPQFSNLLEGEGDLPLLAEAVLRTGLWFNNRSGLLLALVPALAAAAVFLLRQASLRQRLMDALAALPILGDWLAQADATRWASVMSAMLANRVELMDALNLSARGVKISSRRTSLERAAAEVRGGAALAEALEKQDALTPIGCNLVRVGEQSGQLAQMLRSLARLHEESGARRMKRFLNLIEPAAILLIGAVLGTIMLGVILAITSAQEVVL